MKEDGFAWWKQRFQQMSHYFDAFRIDHILGFFRIWSIPTHAVEGIMGYFVPAIPVQIAEFAVRVIPFDHARYLRPYITDVVLRVVFQYDAVDVKRQFLFADGAGHYNLKAGFLTQRQVENYFAVREENEHNHKIKIGLYDLISNVILFDAAGALGGEFHFRFGMADTFSFKTFCGPTPQAKTEGLYA